MIQNNAANRWRDGGKVFLLTGQRLYCSVSGISGTNLMNDMFFLLQSGAYSSFGITPGNPYCGNYMIIFIGSRDICLGKDIVT